MRPKVMALRIGIFHPRINLCGGAEWVAINIMNTLKQNGHKVVILTNDRVDQKKIMDSFSKKTTIDSQIVFPFAFFPPTDWHNIYTDALRSMTLKSKCDILIDTISNAILPGTDIAYIHFPLLKLLSQNPTLKNRVFYLPYRMFVRGVKNLDQKIIFANSKFTAEAIREAIGVRPHVLYPPIQTGFFNGDLSRPRDDTVITVARISPEKSLTAIPYVAKLTDEKISFLIVGLLQSKKVLSSILELIRKLEVSERVKVLTDITRDQLRTILLNSKVYFHPTINEHFGVSIVEAMAFGCIPVVHDSGGPREFVPSGFRYKSMEEAAAKIERAISEWSVKRAEEMSHIADDFSESNFSNKFIDILSDSYVNMKPEPQ